MGEISNKNEGNVGSHGLACQISRPRHVSRGGYRSFGRVTVAEKLLGKKWTSSTIPNSTIPNEFITRQVISQSSSIVNKTGIFRNALISSDCNVG